MLIFFYLLQLSGSLIAKHCVKLMGYLVKSSNLEMHFIKRTYTDTAILVVFFFFFFVCRLESFKFISTFFSIHVA